MKKIKYTILHFILHCIMKFAIFSALMILITTFFKIPIFCTSYFVKVCIIGSLLWELSDIVGDWKYYLKNVLNYY